MPLTYLCIWTSSVFRFHDAIAMVTQNWMVEKFTMCSRGQIMLEIHDAIAMVTQNCVHEVVQGTYRYSLGKKHLIKGGKRRILGGRS